MSNDASTTFVYVTYIRTSAQHLWQALLTPQFTRQYWFGMHMVSDWRSGSSWQIQFADGRIADTGSIIEADPPHRLVIRWRNEFRPEFRAEGYSTCTIELAPLPGAVRLTITHVMPGADSRFINEGVSQGWPRILSNLKSLLETGAIAAP